MCYTAYLYLEEFQSAVDLLCAASREAPSDRVIEMLLKSAKEGLAKSKKQEVEVWGGAMKKQLHHDPGPITNKSISFPMSYAGFILSLFMLGTAVLLGVKYM